jgi:hypothetical protein
MLSGKRALKLLTLVPMSAIISTIFVLLVSAIPASQAQACLPCKCPRDKALNCYGFFHVNTIVDKRGRCAIEVLGYDAEGKKGYLAIYANAAKLAKYADTPKKNTLIAQYYEYALYKLTSGEFQVNVGPTRENKVYVVIFRGCPATEVKETNYVAQVTAGPTPAPGKKKK